MLDLYCERIEPGPFEEPLNTLSNGFFFVAAWFAYRHCRDAGVWTPGNRVLVLLLITIGAGSSAFHAFANRPTLLMDVIPIGLFQLAYLGLYARSLVTRSWPRLIGLYLLFGLMIWAFAQSPVRLNGSVAYFAPLLMLMVLAVSRSPRHGGLDSALLVTIGLFGLSLLFRSIDNAVCSAVTVGTHFLWHAITGLVLYRLIMHRALPGGRQRGVGVSGSPSAPA